MSQEMYTDESDSDSLLDEMEEEIIDLGFLSKVSNLNVFASGDWKNWQAGKVGGKPNWLNPNECPSLETIKCSHCQVPRSFLLQMYCPLDDVSSAFHRALYVYCCTRTECMQQGSFLVLRSQLARENEIYEFESQSNVKEIVHSDRCSVCNLKGTFTCSGCSDVKYCCREHQKQDWVAGHKQVCETKWCVLTSNRAVGTAIGFPEYEIVVDEEPPFQDAVNTREAKMVEDFRNQTLDDSEDPFTNTSEIDISQDQLHDVLGAKTASQDAKHVAFLARVAVAKDQVIRFSLSDNATPLWIHSKKMPTTPIPECHLCGQARRFEFQIMPQLLFYLKESSMDWGTIAIYTCSASCDTLDSYVVEHAYLQVSYDEADKL